MPVLVETRFAIKRTAEFEISIAALAVTDAKPDGITRFDDLRKETPIHVNLTAGDLQFSKRRLSEKIWKQIIRNVHCRHKSANNFIALGYLEHIKGKGNRITKTGRTFLASDP